MPETACKCGAPPHATDPDRCALGHLARGNAIRLVVGQHSPSFWAEAAAAQRAIETAFLRDRGHDAGDAPEALRQAVTTAAQASLVRDAAFLRVAEGGGPLSSADRIRRSLSVWAMAAERLHRALVLIGVERKARPVDALDNYLARRDRGDT